MKRKRSRITGTNIITAGLTMAGGFAAGKYLTSFQFVQANPILGIAAPIAGALVTPMILGKTKLANELAAGMITAAAVGAVQQFAPGLASQAGLGASPYKSTFFPGVAGPNSIAPQVIY
jgi:hypothetical protein